MKLSTLLLSSAALVVAGSAFAADLPAKKGAPAAKAATGCATFGAGFIQVPGTDNCLKIGGYMKYKATFNGQNTSATTAQISQAGKLGLSLDARSNSDLGVIRGFSKIEGSSSLSVSDAYVQFGGLTAGKSTALTDIAGTNPDTFDSFLGGGGSDVGVIYSIPAGAATVEIGAFNAADNNVSSGVADLPDFQGRVKFSAGAVGLTVAGTTHQVESTAGTATGYAFVGKASVTAGIATASIYGGTSKGALLYTGSNSLKDSTTAAADLAVGSNFGGELLIAAGTGTLGLEAVQVTSTLTSSKTTVNSYGVSYVYPLAKGLSVEPELLSTTTQTTSDTSTAQTVYLRITRDF
ncbi:MAG: porin [Hyphomicrobiales bacterium]|nr:porin [Hyphomicrobiales bacterium]